jgi:hypothetical protein
MKTKDVKTVIFGGDPGEAQLFAPQLGKAGKRASVGDSSQSDVGNSRKNKRKELDGFFRDVKELSSTTLVGLARKKKKDDVLTRLGVDAPKQQTMPLRMALGIKAGREKRAKKAMDQAKESGIVTSTSKKQRDDDGRNYGGGNGGTGKGEVRGGLDISTKNGVMRLSKNKVKTFNGGSGGGKKKGRRK